MWLFAPVMLIQAGLLSLLLPNTIASPTHWLVARDEPCDYNHLDNKDYDYYTKTWEKSGAKDFLEVLLDRGPEGWSNDLFENHTKDGRGQGATFNCELPGSDMCGPPTDDCARYKPDEAYFVHMAISVFSNQLEQMAGNIKYGMLSGLTDQIKEAVDIFGIPPDNDKWIFTIISGVLVTAGAMSGPAWTLGSPLAGLLGVNNLVSGFMQKNAPDDPQDYVNDIEQAVGKTFEEYITTLYRARDIIITGNQNYDIPGGSKKFISDTFDHGRFLNIDRTNDVTTDLIINARELLLKGYVIAALKKYEYYVRMVPDSTKEKCVSKEGSYVEWMYDHCCFLIRYKKDKGRETVYGIETFDKKKYDHFTKPSFNRLADKSIYHMNGQNVTGVDLPGEFTGNYGFDYREVLDNAIQCWFTGGRSTPEGFGQIPPFGKPFVLPRCFVNLKVNNDDGDSHSPNEPFREFEENGYTPGVCAIEFEQLNYRTAVNAQQVKIALLDGAGNKFFGADFNPLRPVLLVPGRFSKDGDTLPYDFYYGATIGDVGIDDTTLHFWYGESYWTTLDDKVCEVGDWDDSEKRSGRCEFECKEVPEHERWHESRYDKDHYMPETLTYDRGWCKFHLTQHYTKNWPKHEYKITIRIYDDKDKLVGYWFEKLLSRGESAEINGIIKIKISIDDDEMIHFDYPNHEWSADGDECSLGGWSGEKVGSHRQMDCKFFTK